MIRTSLAIALCAGALFTSRVGRADSPELQGVHTGALLAYAELETRLLFTAITSRELDPAAIKSAASEIKRALEEAKKSTDRTIALLPEAQAKLEPELKKVRDELKTAADQLERFNKDFASESKKMKVEEEPSEEIAAPAGAAPKEDAGQPDFELLRNHVGWLHGDVLGAEASAKKVGAKLAAKLKAPAKPKGKHPE